MRAHPLVGVAIAACLLNPAPVLADFTYQETTQITGGSIMGMLKFAGAFSRQASEAGAPITSTILVKGNRMARINAQETEIIDLDRETITHIDNQKHQFSTVTFAQMKAQLEQASREAEQKQAAEKKQDTPAPAPPSNTEMSFDVHVRQTGANKQVNGQAADEAILTMALTGTDKTTGQSGALAIANDMWMAPEVAGYDEVRDFGKRYAVKMGWILNGAISPSLASAMTPGSGKAMTDMANEMSKIKGLPVMQIMRMGSTVNGQPIPAASEAALPASTGPAMPSAQQVAQGAATSAIASKLGALGGLGGGFSGFGRKKKAEAPAADTAQPTAQPPAYSVLIESSTQMSGFSTASIRDDAFAVPAGYKEIAAPMRNGGVSQ